MSQHASHSTAGHGAGHPKLPPTLPEITDEAGETASWVPALGVVLLVLFGMLGALRLAVKDAEPAPAPAAETVAAAPAAAEAAAAPAQPDAPAQPAPAAAE